MKKLNYKKKWPWAIWLLIGILLSGTFMARWIASQAVEIIIPKFESLKMNHGAIEFSTWWKSSGGDIVIGNEAGREVRITCGGVFVDVPCFRKRKNSVWIDFKDELSGKTATVWWYPDPSTPDFGRLYQLSVEEKIIIGYESQVEAYLADSKRGRPLDFMVALVVFFITVPISVRNLIKGN